MNAAIAELGVEDIGQVVADIFTGLAAADDAPYPVPPEDRGGDVTAAVSITGAWDGHLIVCGSQRFAVNLAELMLGEPTVSQAEIVDAMGELANIVGGNVKATLPGENHLSLPRVLLGDAVEHHPNAPSVLQAEFRWRDEPFSVTLCAVTKGGRR